MTKDSLLHNPLEDAFEPEGAYQAREIADEVDNDFRDYVDNMILEVDRAAAEQQQKELLDAVAESFNQDTYAACQDNVLIMNDMYALGIGPCDEEPTSREYVDAQLAGSLYHDSEADQLLVSDGSGWITATPPPPPIINLENTEGIMVITAGGLAINTPDGEIDVLAKIQQLDERIKELEKNDPVTQAQNKADMEYFQKNLDRQLKPAKDRLAFDKAMKGI